MTYNHKRLGALAAAQFGSFAVVACLGWSGIGTTAGHPAAPAVTQTVTKPPPAPAAKASERAPRGKAATASVPPGQATEPPGTPAASSGGPPAAPGGATTPAPAPATAASATATATAPVNAGGNSDGGTSSPTGGDLP